MKRKYKLEFWQRFLIGVFIIGAFSFLFLLDKEAYHDEFVYEDRDYYLLEKGDYSIVVSYEGTQKENELIVYTDLEFDEHNERGKELAREKLNLREQILRLTLHLEQDTRGVKFRTTQDNEEKQYLTYIVIQSIQLQNRDGYLLGLLCLLSAFLLAVLGWYLPKEKYTVPLLLVGMGLAASMPLFSSLVMGGDDLGFHTGRIEAIYEGLCAGEFPVYLGSTEMGGFGTLSATMYPQLFLYPFALLRFGRISLMFCYKLLVVCMHIGSAFTSYYSAKHMCKSGKIAFWTSIFYTFSIYRLTNVYFRAALGESLAMVFLPLVIWGMYEVLWGNAGKWYLLTLGVGGVLQSHVLSVEMCAFFLVLELLVWLLSAKKQEPLKRIWAGIKATLLTVSLNAFFLLPFLFFWGENLQCFHMPSEPISDSSVYFSQMFSLFAPYEGKDLGLESTVQEMPHTVGLVMLLGIVLLCAVGGKKEAKDDIKVARRCMIYGVLALFMCSWLFPWDKLQRIEVLEGMITSLQFTWRFMGPASALLSFTTAVGVVHFAEKMDDDRKWIYGVAAVLVLCSTSFFFGMKGSIPMQHSDKVQFNNLGYTDAMYMYYDGESYKALNLNYNREDAYIYTQNGTEVEYSDYKRWGTQLRVTVEPTQQAGDYLVFPFYYYPGYEILVNGETAEVYQLDTRVACQLPLKKADIYVHYKGVPGVQIANGVTVLSVLGILLYPVFRRKKEKVR